MKFYVKGDSSSFRAVENIYSEEKVTKVRVSWTHTRKERANSWENYANVLKGSMGKGKQKKFRITPIMAKS